MDRTLSKPEVSTLDTAILLVSSGLFDCTLAADRTDVGPLTCVGKLSIFQRTVLTLQRAGISQISVLVGEEEQPLRSLIHGDSRVHAAVHWLPIREFPPGDPQTWKTLSNTIKGACLILGCHTVFTSSLVESLRAGVKDSQVMVAIGRPGDEGWKANLGLVMRADLSPGDPIVHRVVFQDQAIESTTAIGDGACQLAPAADLVVFPARLLGMSGVWKSSGVGPIRAALEHAAAEGMVQTVSMTSQDYLDVRGPQGVDRAEQMLIGSLQTVKGGLDGFVDRLINRKISGVFTRLFMKLGLSPNAVTIISMVLGLLGAACFASGSYQLGIIGAFLFQLSVIVDCCDGEVARLTFAESQFGQTFDIMADNIVHMAIFAGIAWGSYIEGVWQQNPLPLVLGAIAVAANGISLWFVVRVRSLKAKPLDWQRINGVQRTRLEFILGNITNRDFSMVVVLSACLGLLPWFLGLGAIGSTVFALMMAWTLHRAFSARIS